MFKKAILKPQIFGISLTEYAMFHYDTAEVENSLNEHFRNYRIRQELSFIFFPALWRLFCLLRKRWHIKFKNSKIMLPGC